MYVCVYIYIDVVELNLVQCLPFSVLKIGPFFIFGNLVLTAERRNFKNKRKIEQTQLAKRCVVQLCCATYLDRFLTQPWTSFNTINCVFAETAMFIVFSAKYAKSKTYQKKKYTICDTPVLIALVKMSVFFIFDFGGFRNFHFFRDVFDR